jgi:hypothetical protein
MQTTLNHRIANADGTFDGTFWEPFPRGPGVVAIAPSNGVAGTCPRSCYPEVHFGWQVGHQ